MAAHRTSKILIIGHAPGRIVHETGIPWNDKSGDNLRAWMNIDKETFYDPKKIGIMPMGFCYPGTGKSGDLAPRKECAPLWHPQLLEKMNSVKLTLLLGKHAQDYYLPLEKKKNLTEKVKNYKSALPQFLPLPHPSPRNNIWMKKNPWFKEEVIPYLQKQINTALNK